MVKRFTDIPIKCGFNLKKMNLGSVFTVSFFFAIPKLFLYASELLISQKFCQTSIIFQRKHSFAEVKVDCLCWFFSDGGVTGV